MQKTLYIRLYLLVCFWVLERVFYCVLLSEYKKQLSDTKIRTMNEKERQEALLRTQSMMLQVLVSQYEVMQNMNAMYASMALDTIQETNPKQADTIKPKKIEKFKRNDIGQPDFTSTFFESKRN